MIKKILIANRAAIASRIIRTCKEIGIKTVAIYSEADKDAPFVINADECILIGKAHVNDSYLNANKIIEIAKQKQVDAIHPGYGFLSENSEFAKLCEAEGIIFIGPSSKLIKQMGNKIEARKQMKQYGIPIIPGTNKPLHSIEEAKNEAMAIGYPVLLKASAGGGGIGMQVINKEEDLEKTFPTVYERATKLFGDGTMYIEKKIEPAHHIEIQVLADTYGNVIHLFERECSIQRRNQKVIEEAPSPFLSSHTRKKMTEIAVQAIKKLQYTNAGTIEFLVDSDGNFYFLEMNTRIQVEHGITEEITGIDIVKEQIKIASGKALTLKQADIRMDGHAIEARIYAEDPKTFFPSPGKVTLLSTPTGMGIRNEIAIKENMTVSPFYDPMIAKLIVKGRNRQDTIEKMNFALDNYTLKGIKTNIPMLKNIIENDQFLLGNTTTSFVQEQYLQSEKLI